MRTSRWMYGAAIAAIVTAAALAGSVGVSRAPGAATAKFPTALVSDVAGFNDNAFNKNQLSGLQRAEAQLGITGYPLVSHTAGEYRPNYRTAIVTDHAKLVIATGFLLAGTVRQYATAYPNVKFAITDDSVSDIGGRANEEGITFATQESGCLVGVLAAKMAQRMGTKKIGAVGGFPIAAVDSYVAGYKFCANRAVPGTTTLVRYSYDFDTKSKCSTIAKNEIHQGAQVIFQVAGPCGDGALTAAAALGKWGIGVDTDESAVAPGHILTSAVKKTDVSVFKVIHGALTNDWQGGKDLVLSLKDNGVGVGTIAPQVPASWKSLLLSYKQKIVSGAIKPPDHCPGAHC